MDKSSITGRPLFILCSAFFTLYFILLSAPVFIKIFLAVSASAAAVGFTVLYICGKHLPFHINGRIAALVCAAIILSSVYSLIFVDRPITKAESLIGKVTEAELTVLEVEHVSSYLSSYYAELYSAELNLDEKVLVTMTDATAVPGDVFSCRVVLGIPSTDDAAVLYSNGAFLTAEAGNVTYLRHEKIRGISAFFSMLNSNLSSLLRRGDDGSLASAVLLGDREHLSTSVKRDFSRLGIYHLLAVSGLHLSVIVAIADRLTEKQSKMRKGVIKAAVVILFMALTGFSVSVTRAGIMHLTAILASTLDREGDSLTSLSLSAALIILLNPSSAYDVGLILSVLAAYACITYSHITGESKSRLKGIPVFGKLLHSAVDTVKLTLLICAFTMPVMWRYFGSLSLISPLANIFYIPAVTLLLILSIVFLITSQLPVPGSLTGAALYFTEDVITSTANAVSNLENITVSLNYTGVGVFSALLMLSVLPIILTSKKTRRLLGISAAASAAGLALCITIGIILQSTTCCISYTARGENEGILIRDGGVFTVIDVTEGSGSLMYELFSLAAEDGAGEIDNLILTHYHNAHVPSVTASTDRTVVRRVLLPRPLNEDETEVYEKLTEALALRGVEYTVYDRKRNEVFETEGLSVRFYDCKTKEESAHPIVSFLITLCGNEYLYASQSINHGDPSLIYDAEHVRTVIIGAHPPKSDEYLLPKIHGNAVLSERVKTDKLMRRLSQSNSITVVENGTVYTTEAVPRNED